MLKIKQKSSSKKLKKKNDKKKVDVAKEVGTINGFTIIEKFSEDKKITTNEIIEKNINKEQKNDLDDLNNLDDKNKSFFKNWIVYDNPNESRFAKFFKELEEDKKQKNEIKSDNKENEPKEEDEQEEDETSNIYDNISNNPSEDNSRDSRAHHDEHDEHDDDIKNYNSLLSNFEIYENSYQFNQEEKVEIEKKEEEMNLDLNINDIISQKDKRSTLMIKNIPNKFNQEYILNIINQNFKGTFDIFVLPTDINKYKNFGYAFINFTSSYYVPYFYFMFNGKMWFGTNSHKICELAYSKVQGKLALLNHYPSKIVFCNEEALAVTPEQKYIIPNIYKLYFNECFPKEKIEEYKSYFVTKMPN